MDNNEQFEIKTNEELRRKLAAELAKLNRPTDHELLISQLRNGRTQGHDQR